ncbi:MAG: hypothetical protein ACC656_12175, partial [Candidatus Heimdallarchaeota archaeon]
KIWFRTFARPLEEIQHVGGGTNSVRESLYGYDLTRVQPQIDQPSKDPKFDYTKIDRTVFNHWTNFVRPYSDSRHDWSYRPIYSFVSGKYLVTPYLFDNYTDDIWVGDEIVGIQVREISTRTQLYYYSNYDTWFMLIGLIITNYSTYRIIRISKLGPTTDKI